MKQFLKTCYLWWLYRKCPGYIHFAGNRFYLDEGDSLRLYRNGTYSPYLIDVCKEILRDIPNPTFVDAGASVGWFTVNCQHQCDRVVAFEPNKEQYNVLMRNIYYHNNVRVANLALWSTDGRRPLYIDPNNGSGGRLYATDNRPTQHIQSVTLDTALKMVNVKSVDLIKIDCEGAEGHIIEGFRRLEVLRPTIILEFTPTAMIGAKSSPVRMWKRLFGYGDVFYLDEQNKKKIPRNRTDSLCEGNYLITPR